jgi:primosomal protein N' (replication factor Y) (superfamily II helicase)
MGPTGRGPQPPLVVRVLPDVPAIDKTFDYLVPETVRDQVRVGDVVRIPLHGRRVGGWVMEVGVTPPAGVALQPLARRSGLGPGPEIIELAHWGAWRWAGRTASFLRTAAPERVVAGIPAPAPAPPSTPASGHEPTLAALASAAEAGAAVLRLPPAADRVAVVLTAARLGNVLVLCPSVATARGMAARLRRRGLPLAEHPEGWAAGMAGTTVVGTRSAVWAPVGGLAAVVVIDEHEEAHQQEQAPTWHARDVAVERARRAGVPCLLTSPCPTLEALAAGPLHAPPRPTERAGWPVVEVVDRREEDPYRAGLFSPALVRTLRGDGRVLCVLNRTGRSRLLACAACGAVARCEACGAAARQPAEVLVCDRCGTERPVVCLECGGTRLRNIRAGVARVREELAALAGEPVEEVTAASDAAPAARVVVGTEAVLQRVDRADVVAFLDLDQELLAPRYRAAEQALALVARAARIAARSGPAGARAAGRVLVQTRSPDHEVVRAAVHGDPARVADAERDRRELFGFPPATALAAVSGPAAGAFVEALGRPLGVEVVELGEGRWLLRSTDHRTLCDALSLVPRPPGRLRLEVDPLRV